MQELHGNLRIITTTNHTVKYYKNVDTRDNNYDT